MEQTELRVRLNAILKAIAAGHTCEEILAADRTLSYHDIFHAVAEAPTTYWERAGDGDEGTELMRRLEAARTPAIQRTD